MLKTFTVATEQDSVRTAFSKGPRLSDAPLSLEKSMDSYPEYVLKQGGVPVAILRGKEMVAGGEHFAVIPFLPVGWAEQGGYALSNANVPYWDGEQRLRSLDALLYSLSSGACVPAALDDAVDADDDEFFAGIPEVIYTGQPAGQQGQPEQTPPAGTTSGRAYPWTFWYRGRGGNAHQVILEATYEDAQRVWDKLSTTLDMTSKRP